MEKTSEINNESRFWSWVGFLLPPLAWSAALEAVYLTNNYACGGISTVWSHLSSAVGLCLCLLGGFISWSQLSKTPDANRPRRFLSLLGVVLAAGFALLTIAQWLPVAYGVPCSK